jgi:hypothetical protein
MNLLTDPPAVLGLDPDSPRRVRYFAAADRDVIHLIGPGVLFVMAWWSGPARVAFARLRRVLDGLDPHGRLELAVVDTDRADDLFQLPEFFGKIHGAGETAWVRDGRIVHRSGIGYHPECFGPNTAALLRLSGR